MEEEIQQSQETVVVKPELSPIAISHLKETAPWMKFIGIVGLIMCLILVLISIIILIAPLDASNVYTNMLSNGMKIFLAMIYIVISIILMVPNLYLISYSTRIKNYIKTNNITSLEKAFSSQKSLYIYVGVLTIIQLSFTSIVFIGFVIGMLAGFMTH